MKVLIACEYSGIVREAFAAKGHYAFSCDILPTEIPGLHYQGDVMDIINNDWDMIIAFPPCTYLAKCGLHYLKTRPERSIPHQKAVDFFLSIYNNKCPRIAIENPEGWMNTNFKKPDQIIQPYYFGDNEIKTTCLWLKGLPLLIPSNMLERPKPSGFCIRKSGKNKGSRYNYYFRDGKNAKQRAKTFQGIAKGMADQWG